MAKNSVDAYGAEGKTNVLLFDPEALMLVVDKTSPLYDSRVHLPVDDALVRNIMYQGVIEPVVVCKNAETGAPEVVAGRQRVKAAREANKRLHEQGRAPIQVPAVIRKSLARNPGALTEVMISENEIRRDDTPLGRAEKMAKLQALGRTEAQIAEVFGCVVATVKSTLALLDCTKVVKDAVEVGAIGLGHAAKLAKLTPDEQRAKVAELTKAAEGVPARAKVAAQRAIVGSAPKMRSRKEIYDARSALPPDAAGDVARKWLTWVLGEN